MTYGCCTLEDVAKELGVTRERARQIQNIALAKLRKNCEAMGYQAEDLIPDLPPAKHDIFNRL
jgi:DNA-directed RNA polymerase sigma subunit (sigma70/sigma32)